MKCLKCGNCCRTRSIDITWTDILRWNDEKRWDILSEVSYIKNDRQGFNRCFFEKSVPNTKDGNRPCPFLSENNKCNIYETRPRGCREAPLSYVTFDECPVFDKYPDDVIQKHIQDQTNDILAVTKYINVVMPILVKAREQWVQ